MKVKNLKGTRDFYPELQRELDYIFGVWRKVCVAYGYEAFDGPLLEPTDLWTLKSGNEIPDQMYSFTDKGGRKVAIRPELTPTLARMVAQKQKELVKPIKWFSIPRCWRYERPQSGRLREFFQLNVDCLGTDSMKADAEVIATAVSMMEEFGLTSKDVYVRLCNRKLLEDLFLKVVDKKKLSDLMRLVDKMDKLKPKDFDLSLKYLGVKPAAVKKIVKISSLDDINVKKLSERGKEGYDELKELVGYLNSYGMKKYVKLDFSISRGLDYYTSTVFEIFDATKEFRAVAGGGRYDDLVSDFGGEKCPGVGYGMGDVVLSLFLKKKGKMPQLVKGVDYYVVTIGNVYKQALKLVAKLRADGKSVEIAVSEMNASKQLKYAQRIGAKNLLFVGKDELKAKKFKVKNVKTGKEKLVSF